MPIAYSVDLRERVVGAYRGGEGTQQEIAQRFQVSPSFVQRLLRRQREGRPLEAKQRGGNHLAKIRGCSPGCGQATGRGATGCLLIRVM